MFRSFTRFIYVGYDEVTETNSLGLSRVVSEWGLQSVWYWREVITNLVQSKPWLTSACMGTGYLRWRTTPCLLPIRRTSPSVGREDASICVWIEERVIRVSVCESKRGWYEYLCVNQREGDTSLTSSPFVRPLVSPWSGGYQSGQSVGFSSSFTYLIFLFFFSFLKGGGG